MASNWTGATDPEGLISKLCVVSCSCLVTISLEVFNEDDLGEGRAVSEAIASKYDGGPGALNCPILRICFTSALISAIPLVKGILGAFDGGCDNDWLPSRPWSLGSMCGVMELEGPLLFPTDPEVRVGVGRLENDEELREEVIVGERA